MKYIIISILTLTFLSCGSSENKESLEQLDTKSAREVSLVTLKAGDSVYHITKQVIWFNGQQIASKADTITTANKIASWGESADQKTLSEVPIYVTVQ